jgi:hypothetical protein
LADSDHLSVSGRIVAGLAQIMTASDNLALMDDNRPDRHLGQSFGGLGFGHGLLHKYLVELRLFHKVSTRRACASSMKQGAIQA